MLNLRVVAARATAVAGHCAKANEYTREADKRIARFRALVDNSSRLEVSRRVSAHLSGLTGSRLS